MHRGVPAGQSCKWRTNSCGLHDSVVGEPDDAKPSSPAASKARGPHPSRSVSLPRSDLGFHQRWVSSRWTSSPDRPSSASSACSTAPTSTIPPAPRRKYLPAGVAKRRRLSVALIVFHGPQGADRLFSGQKGSLDSLAAKVVGFAVSCPEVLRLDLAFL